MGQTFNGNGGEAVHAVTNSAQSAAVAAINHGSAAGLFALSEHGEGVHSEGSDGFAGMAAFGRGTGAGVFAKGLGGGPGIHAESTGNAPGLDGVAHGTGAGAYAKSLGGGPGIHAESTGSSPALDGVAVGNGAGVYAKSLGGGPAAFLDGNVDITGNLTIQGVSIQTWLQRIIALEQQHDQLVRRVNEIYEGTAQSLITLAARVTALEQRG
jgi:hypothetical protein